MSTTMDLRDSARRLARRAAPPARGWRRGVFVLGCMALVVGVVGLAAHYVAPSNAAVMVLSAGAAVLMLGGPIAVVLCGVTRHWVGTGLAAVVTGWAMVIQLPLFVAVTPPAEGPKVMMMTANLRLGLAEPSSVVNTARANGVEVLILEELTQSEQNALESAGLDELLPYHASDPRVGARGTGIWSRYPLTEVTKRTDFEFAFVTAHLALPGVTREPLVVGLHLAGPWPDSANWKKDASHLAGLLPSFADSGPTLVAGDFNATPDISQFRNLLTDGYADAASQAGAGVTATFPNDQWYGPLVAIDHVLTRSAVATHVHTATVTNSDHRALIASVSLDEAGT